MFKITIQLNPIQTGCKRSLMIGELSLGSGSLVKNDPVDPQRGKKVPVAIRITQTFLILGVRLLLTKLRTVRLKLICLLSTILSLK